MMLTMPLLSAQPQASGALGRAGSAPCTDGVLVLITWPNAPDKKTAQAALDALRQNLRDFTSRKDVCVVEKAQSDQMLTTSGYKTDTILTTADAITLANTIHADEIVETAVQVLGARSFQFTGRLVLARDLHEQLRDSVPKPQPGEMSLAAKQFIFELKKVRAQLEFDKKCYTNNREGKYTEAEAAARQGIGAYPAATISRICLAVALKGQKKPAETVLAVIDEIRKRDPNNLLAVRLALDVYFDKEDHAKYAELGSHLITLDPTNSAVETIIDNLALWKMTDVVLPLLRKALEQDPENKSLLIADFKLTYSAGKWKEAAAKGEGIAKLDTAIVDTLFVRRMFSAYGQDSQPQKVLEWLNRGLAKFPDNIAFAQGVAQQLRTLGQFQQSITAYERVLKINPKEPGIRLRMAQSYANDLKQTDSAFIWLRRAAEAGDDKAQIGQLAYNFGAAQINVAQTSKAVDDYKKALPFLIFSDSISANDPARLLWGTAALQIGFAVYQKLLPPATPTCEIAKEAGDWLDVANEKIRGGARANPTNAAANMDNVVKLQPAIESIKTQLKCGS